MRLLPAPVACACCLRPLPVAWACQRCLLSMGGRSWVSQFLWRGLDLLPASVMMMTPLGPNRAVMPPLGAVPVAVAAGAL